MDPFFVYLIAAGFVICGIIIVFAFKDGSSSAANPTASPQQKAAPPTQLASTPTVSNHTLTVPVSQPSTLIYQSANYSVLRFVSACMRLLGWIVVALSAFLFLVLLMILLAVQSSNGPSFISFVSTPILVPLVMGSLIVGLTCVGFGELIRVFLDIALHTAYISSLLTRELQKAAGSQ
jgi:hypothetical protein